jgi:hypothetical protein
VGGAVANQGQGDVQKWFGDVKAAQGAKSKRKKTW